MADGYTGKVLKVDLTREKIATEPLNRAWAKKSKLKPARPGPAGPIPDPPYQGCPALPGHA